MFTVIFALFAIRCGGGAERKWFCSRPANLNTCAQVHSTVAERKGLDNRVGHIHYIITSSIIRMNCNCNNRLSRPSPLHPPRWPPLGSWCKAIKLVE